jgi:RND family efflux transporter MFP subunit
MRTFLLLVALVASALAHFSHVPALAADGSNSTLLWTSLDGVIQPFETIQVGASSAGVIAEVLVERGARVQRGEVLARLDAEVERQSAELARLNATSSAELEIAQVKLASAKEKLEKRTSLAADGIVTQEELQEARTELALAKLEIASAKEKSALAAVEYKKAQVMVARAEITAPADAVVLVRKGCAGEVVTSSPDAAIFTLARLDPLRVEVRAPVSWLAELELGQTAAVVPTFDESLELTARLTVIDAVADAASETVRLEFELPNPDLSLPAGVRCHVMLAD